VRDLYEELIQFFQAEHPRARKWVHADCPFCGDEADARKPNFSFSPLGFNCFTCGRKGGLKALAEHVGIWDAKIEYIKPTKTTIQPLPPPYWWNQRFELLAQYTAHPETVEMWQRYKPLSKESIRRWRFGYGKLPGESYERLIVPIIHHNDVIALRGRSVNGEEPKWKNAVGSKMGIWNLDGMGQNNDIWLVENHVDAALLMQDTDFPNTLAIATGMARMLSPEELNRIVLAKPQMITVAYDNDLIGQANATTRALLTAQRRPDLPPIEPVGPKVIRQLRERGIECVLFEWPENAKPKADLGDLLAIKESVAV
jgi:hypothetical protein